jgi:shikimate kinase
MSGTESPVTSPAGEHLVLLGLMGSGKSSIGRRVAERLGWPLLDGDECLAERTGGRTAAEIADERGLDALHDLEADIAHDALSAADPTVIGPAASVCESPTVREALADQMVVWLTAPADHLARHAATKSHRPLLERGDATELFERQLAVRQPLVLPLAGLVIDVSTVTIDEAVDQIVDFVLRG